MKQIDQSQYDKKVCTVVKALTVKNPYAWLIMKGRKKIEVRSKNTTYRGRLFITSSQKPEIREMKSGFMLCSVDLYMTKPVSQFTEQDFIYTCIDRSEWPNLCGYGWYLRDVQETEIIPTKGQLGIYNIYLRDKRLEDIQKEAERRHKIRELIIVVSLMVLVTALFFVFIFPLLF